MRSIMHWVLTALLLGVFQFHGVAQETRNLDLAVGDVASPLQIRKWVKGDSVGAFEKGKSYLIEFSSLACGPCNEAIPHLHQVAEEFAGRMKVIVLTDVFLDNTAGNVEWLDRFVKAKGDTLNYNIALDKDRHETRLSWYTRLMAPKVFIVNGEGRVVWIGSPFALYGRLINKLITKSERKVAAPPQQGAFAQTIAGHAVGLYTIRNKKGDFQATVTNYGARLVYLQTPGKNGSPVAVAAGFDSLSDYIDGADHFTGATVGRVVNRLSSTKLVLEGKESTLQANYGPGLIHGGRAGFNTRIWDAKQIDDSRVEFSLLSPDGDGGFPGNLQVKVVYSIEKDKNLTITYEATTDKPTIVNLSNHIYWNLNGEGSTTVLNHLLTINADKYLPFNDDRFPTGTIESVNGTPLDFRKPTRVGDRINDTLCHVQDLEGYDHDFILTSAPGKSGLSKALSITGDKTGITMQVSTTEAGLHFSSGNVLYGMNLLQSGSTDVTHSAFAVQTQHFPDAPNHPAFPSIELRPGENYHSVTEFSFSIK